MTPTHDRRTTGALGEQVGEAYLKERGYEILERNVRSPFGEIDLVAREAGTLVFIEVKTRRSRLFGFPEEAVSARKRERLFRLASWYLSQRWRTKVPVRFDVLAVELFEDKPAVRLIQNAFEF